MKLVKILVLIVVVGLAASSVALARDQLRDRDSDQIQLQQKDQLKDCDVSCDQTPDVMHRDQLRTQDCLLVPPPRRVGRPREGA